MECANILVIPALSRELNSRELAEKTEEEARFPCFLEALALAFVDSPPIGAGKPAPKGRVDQWRERFDRAVQFLISSAIG